MGERIVIRDVEAALANIDEIESVKRNHLIRYQYALSLIKSGSSVLDVACGSGYGSKMLALHDCKVTAMDNSEEALDLCNQFNDHPNIRWLQGDISNLKNFIKKPLDAIVSFETLEHLPDGQEKILKLFDELVKNNGVIVTSIPLNHPDTKWHKRQFTWKERDKLYSSVFKRYEYPEINKSLVVAWKN
jgi:2-polyprenyl-3-methyl-5-hydroxy-6-metoxy-1,4-benzoquinol methylase